jgi:hypothetical protein
MKIKFLSLLTIILISCASPNYYQVYKANTENGRPGTNGIVFEDDNCRVVYNLWKDGGDIGFGIYNKTSKDLTLDLTKTFFVINGIAYEYFQNRTFSKSSSFLASSSTYNFPYSRYRNTISTIGTTSTSSHGTSYTEKPKLTIPPMTMVFVSEFNITEYRYINCDLRRFPSKSEIKTIRFERENSPFVFNNLITYSTAADTFRLENKFYVSEITNLPESSVIKDVDTSSCGTRLVTPIKIFTVSAPDKFYYKYSE